jgi:hypothetical protein
VTEANKVELVWQTASELNNDFFTIQRSVNSIDWEDIEKIEGAENSFDEQTYVSVDKDGYFGTSFYRLKQTDFDGTFTYSPIVIVHIDPLTNRIINIYPNPANDYINIGGAGIEARQITIQNALGQNISSALDFMQESENKVVINIAQLATGIYYLRTKTAAHKFFKE